MAICGGCGADRTRTRTIFNENGTVRTEECQSCAPGSFEPDWLTAKGATPWEAYPDKYTKITNPDGSITYRSTDEWRQDSEDKLRASYERADQIEAYKVEEKRRNRRTTPMTPDEIARATNIWRPYFEDRTEQGNRRWNAAIKELIQ
jgi:hypothetical protein